MFLAILITNSKLASFKFNDCLMPIQDSPWDKEVVAMLHVTNTVMIDVTKFGKNVGLDMIVYNISKPQLSLNTLRYRGCITKANHPLLVYE